MCVILLAAWLATLNDYSYYTLSPVSSGMGDTPFVHVKPLLSSTVLDTRVVHIIDDLSPYFSVICCSDNDLCC